MTDDERSIRLGYAILCDHVVTDGAGKNTLVGVFDRIFVPSVPAQQPRCFLVAEVRGIPGTYEARLAIRGDAGDDIMPTFGPLKIELSPDYGSANMRMELINLPLLRLGQYHLVIEIDGEAIGERVLYVEKRKG